MSPAKNRIVRLFLLCLSLSTTILRFGCYSSVALLLTSLSISINPFRPSWKSLFYLFSHLVLCGVFHFSLSFVFSSSYLSYCLWPPLFCLLFALIANSFSVRLQSSRLPSLFNHLCLDPFPRSRLWQ